MGDDPWWSPQLAGVHSIQGFAEGGGQPLFRHHTMSTALQCLGGGALIIPLGQEEDFRVRAPGTQGCKVRQALQP